MNLALFAAVFILDQISKALAVRFLAPRASLALWGNALRLTYHENTGAAFGFFRGETPVLAFLSLVFIVIAFGYLAATRRAPLARRALFLVLGGAAGNALDRLRLGHVVDFIDVGFWPVFNVADSAITIGALLLLVSMFARRKTP